MRNLKQTVLGGHLGLALNGAKTYTALAGTVAVTNGGTGLVGTGTTFTAGMAGKTFAIKINSDPINPVIVIVTVSAFVDTTHLTLSAAWTGDTLAALKGYNEAVNAASASNKPVSTVPANWLPIGTLLKLKYDRGAGYDDVMAPSPAAMARTGKLLKEIKPKFSLTLNEVSEDILGSVFGAALPTDGTPFTPESDSGLIIGWWQMSWYDQAGNEGVTIEQFGAGMVQSFETDGGQIKPVIEVDVFHNALATGTTLLASLTT